MLSTRRRWKVCPHLKKAGIANLGAQHVQVRIRGWHGQLGGGNAHLRPCGTQGDARGEGSARSAGGAPCTALLGGGSSRCNRAGLRNLEIQFLKSTLQSPFLEPPVLVAKQVAHWTLVFPAGRWLIVEHNRIYLPPVMKKSPISHGMIEARAQIVSMFRQPGRY